MFGRAKAKAREAANKLREFEQNHQLGERVKAAAESVASAVEEKAQAFADIASEVIAGTEETGPSLGVVLVAVADEAECEAIARLVRGSHSGFTSAGRWEVVKSATLADAKAVLDQPLQRLAAVITRVDLPEVAPPPADARQALVTTHLASPPGAAPAGAHSSGQQPPEGGGGLVEVSLTPQIAGVQVGGLALVDWCRSSAGGGVPCVVLTPSMTGPRPPVMDGGGMVSFDPPPPPAEVTAQLHAAARGRGASFVWGAAEVGVERVQELTRALAARERARRQAARAALGRLVPLRVWACTFNVACEAFADFGAAGAQGDAAAQAQLSKLAPPGYDVYLLGIQEGVGDTLIGALGRLLERGGYGCMQLPGQGGRGCPRIEGRGDGSMLMSKYTGVVGWARTPLIRDGQVQVMRTATQ